MAATARFHFRRKTLTYSLVTSEEFGIPKFLTFMDPEKNIIEEFPIQDSIFQVQNAVQVHWSPAVLQRARFSGHVRCVCSMTHPYYGACKCQ